MEELSAVASDSFQSSELCLNLSDGTRSTKPLSSVGFGDTTVVPSINRILGYFCHQCCSKFGDNSQAYIEHSRAVHQINIVGCCDKCWKSFQSVSGFQNHMKMHAAEKSGLPRCEICGKFVQSNAHLQKHMRRHSASRPFACEVVT